MSIYLGNRPLAHNAVSRNIGEIIQSTIPLSDAGLHLLDGALISGAGSYGAFVTYIAGLVSSHPDLFTTETAWQQSITDYGVCGKFVYDSTNNTVRLPKITGFVEGTTDVTALGNLVEAGLPNITGSFGGARTADSAAGGNTGGQYNTGICSGALKGGTVLAGENQNLAVATRTGGRVISGLDFNASQSNSIYGNSSTVQPQAIKVLYYIVIANSVKTNIEVDIDEIATDLNGKADVDLSNVNANGTALASGWSMPSDRSIDLTLGASGATYTAPANGWVYLRKSVTSVGQYVLCRQGPAQTVGWGVLANNQAYILHPVRKGNFIVAYSAASGTDVVEFRFVYAEGEN